jgi:hypothetical protein
MLTSSRAYSLPSTRSVSVQRNLKDQLAAELKRVGVLGEQQRASLAYTVPVQYDRISLTQTSAESRSQHVRLQLPIHALPLCLSQNQHCNKPGAVWRR